MPTEHPALSVVVPTHCRSAILKRCLEHLAAQTIAEEIEVIVVSDGHDADTAALFQQEKSEEGKEKRDGTSFFDSLDIRFLEIEKSHQGVARNRGVEMARAPIVLFAQDDIFLAPSACEEHQLAHAALQFTGDASVAVLGHIAWDPALPQTPVLRWLDQTGWQFGYRMLAMHEEDFIPRDLQHRFTYTSHISLPTAIAKAYPFREDVTLYGWEDMEWGMRLRSAGVRLFYIPSAKAVHHHPMDLEQSLKRMETLGASAAQMERMVPGFDRMPKGWKLWAYRAMGWLPTMRGRHAGAFVIGLNEGARNKEQGTRGNFFV